MLWQASSVAWPNTLREVLGCGEEFVNLRRINLSLFRSGFVFSPFVFGGLSLRLSLRKRRSLCLFALFALLSSCFCFLGLLQSLCSSFCRCCHCRFTFSLDSLSVSHTRHPNRSRRI